jgi:hypothetical protein
VVKHGDHWTPPFGLTIFKVILRFP